MTYFSTALNAALNESNAQAGNLIAVKVTENPNTVAAVHNGITHSARWSDDEELTDVVGDPNLLRAVMTAWCGEPEFKISDADLHNNGGGWW